MQLLPLREVIMVMREGKIPIKIPDMKLKTKKR
jgi:hypothetical protein